MSIVYDTDVTIAYKIDYQTPRVMRGVLLCTVVIHELIGGAPDVAARNAMIALKEAADKQDRLITPNAEDWIEAGSVLYALRHGLKSRAKGKTPSIPATEVQRITRDVLIARTIRRHRAVLVTNNIGDYERIARFCRVRVESGKVHFGY